jgi:hypothetical protein
MAQEFWGFPNKADYARACKAIRAVERMEARPKKGRRGNRRGGASVTSLTHFAIVRVEAELDRGSTGKCILLNEDLDPEVEIDEEAEGYDHEAYEAALIEFQSADFVDAEVDKRVILHSDDPIEPGSLFEDHKIYGTLVEYPLPGVTCETIVYVTDVECVDDEIVVTTDSTEVVTGPCP